MTKTPGPCPLPTTIANITTAWLEAALAAQAPGIGLTGSRILDVMHGTCTKIRVALERDAAARAAGIPAQVILKGGFEPHSRLMDYMHAHEVHAYADVAPLTALRQPTCYFAGFDAEARQGIVILEDLVARGVEFLHPQRPLPPEAVARRLEVLARHHALTWEQAAPFAPGGAFAWADDFIDGFYRYGAQILTPPVWQGFVQSARGAAASVRFHSLDWFLTALGKLSALGRTIPRVLVHGDTHLGNLYVDIDGEPGFFDSQPHVGPALCEVAYHVTGALDMADRHAHDRDLVAHYRQALAAEGIAPPPLDEMMRQFGCYLAFGYGIFLVNASDFQPEAINTAYTARFSAAMLDHDTIGLIARL
ncbi:phosphotransferase [Novosphingobium album (ex Liu et al. 2023)]|uniref:Phosphotransferase n=1 Tax=Novosphingobium album (ex Liu et al. 2023) TaxID=3031130 RepID=A0ABT5WQS4_9SPHN|nr:phosphotransferase [Novosphingobium album (ex Liu et al. 2023)]MDE8652369.1 phosphotransferase [Novosphingobium album (ex Liu et al. 2023)]